jgi:hypothetical protein
MPIRQYFLWVGSILLAALFVADWGLPSPATRPHSEIPPNQRANLSIRSDQKWPERIVLVTAPRVSSLVAQALPARESRDAAAEQAGPRDTFAAAGSRYAGRAATNDKPSAIRAKPWIPRFHISELIKAD